MDDGWVDRWMDGWEDEWMDGWMDETINNRKKNIHLAPGICRHWKCAELTLL